ncbi:uncharacterized protein [Misgurnus anguillicaudatus]|uniref:uncharacterized protein isoform X2 n=1 Tax=Misgurnus anguillicaudatus TaxID=75329 RepID=UPI0024351333|nr:uncharacterized protein si:dkey-262k9.2 isoform X2 [Misgurnus anguillicaudatus]
MGVLKNKKMLRLLFVFLILRCAAVAAQEIESSGNACGDENNDDECDDTVTPRRTRPLSDAGFDQMSKGEIDESKADEKGTLIIVIAAVSVVALAIVAVIAIVFFRRYLRSQEQGVYTMPVDQVQKAAV